jgi:hypothetical protein
VWSDALSLFGKAMVILVLALTHLTKPLSRMKPMSWIRGQCISGLAFYCHWRSEQIEMWVKGMLTVFCTIQTCNLSVENLIAYVSMIILSFVILELLLQSSFFITTLHLISALGDPCLQY